jgi:hypothetical protein
MIVEGWWGGWGLPLLWFSHTSVDVTGFKRRRARTQP